MSISLKLLICLYRVFSSVPQHLIQETQASASTLRSEVVNILTKARPPKQNIGKEDRSILINLAKNEDILILPMDKRKTTVIIDKSEHTTKL